MYIAPFLSPKLLGWFSKFKQRSTALSKTSNETQLGCPRGHRCHRSGQSKKYRPLEHVHILVAGDRVLAQNEFSFGQTTLSYILNVLLEY